MLDMTEASVWRCRDHVFPLGERTLIMGIVNVTPDSFSDGGMFNGSVDAVKHGLRQLAEGADILDIGGESTRPGSDPVAVDEELARVLAVVRGLHAEAPGAAISIDTRRAAVAREALRAGACLVNDVTAASDPEMFEVVAEAGAGLVLMHMRGEPKTMQLDPHYVDVVTEVLDLLAARIGAAVAAGVPRDHLCVDPGIGFGKTLQHNLALLHDVAGFRELRVPVLVGTSRKGFIGQLTGVVDPADRLGGSAGAVAWCAGQGVDVLRVHDVAEMARVVQVVDAIVRGAGP